MKVALVLYPGFTALVVVRPFQVLAAAPRVHTMRVAHELGSAADITARCRPVVATATFSGVPASGVVAFRVASSGLDLDLVIVDWSRKAHAATSGTTSVGTGRRVVQDGRVTTAAGSTAGSDMALALLGLSRSPAAAPPSSSPSSTTRSRRTTRDPDPGTSSDQ